LPTISENRRSKRSLAFGERRQRLVELTDFITQRKF
jgi:hypothetical protein